MWKAHKKMATFRWKLASTKTNKVQSEVKRKIQVEMGSFHDEIVEKLLQNNLQCTYAFDWDKLFLQS